MSDHEKANEFEPTHSRVESFPVFLEILHREFSDLRTQQDQPITL